MWSTLSQLLGLLGCRGCVWGTNPLLEHGDFVSMPLGYTSGPCPPAFLPSSPESIHTLEVQLHLLSRREGCVIVMWGHSQETDVYCGGEEGGLRVGKTVSRSVMNAVQAIMPDGDRFLCVKSHKWKCHHLTAFTLNQQNSHTYRNTNYDWSEFQSTFCFLGGIY